MKPQRIRLPDPFKPSMLLSPAEYVKGFSGLWKGDQTGASQFSLKGVVSLSV